MQNIYLATLKNFISENQFNEEKYKFLVIKEHNYKLKKLIRNQKPVSVSLVESYCPSDKYLLSFKVNDYQSVGFKAYIDSKFEEFIKESNNINKESISNFFKFLEADGLYHFEALLPNEKLNEPSAPIKLPEILNEEVLTSSQNFLDTKHDFSLRSRFNSLSEEKTETEGLNRSNSLPKLTVENYNIESKKSSTSSLESFENESPKLCSGQFVNAEKLCKFFAKSNSDKFDNIKNHGEKIKSGYFNGKEKSQILLSISNLAEKIKNTSLNLGHHSTAEEIAEFKKFISTLDSFINDQANLEKLSSYRGFSSFKCFATLWGGGKVTSIEYVNQLRNELKPLVDEVFSNGLAI